MLSLLKRYHSDLVARTEGTDPQSRYADVQLIMLPWTVPVVVALAVCAIFQPGEVPRGWLVAMLCGPALIGALYAGAVFMVYGIRADIRRSKEKRENE